ncbi:hypothetical protein [Phaeovulum sp. W22_SRMD_FR3]|uniref:hypothetical protein n=1 Tax=Phaeovulum sp. W22_SRMD_FR3 TaxID=3240274 RepID=UPI003F97E212
MQILRLKFADAVEAELPLSAYWADTACTLVQVFPTETSGETGAEGPPVVALVSGYHVDLLAREAVDLSPLTGWGILPATPQHRFAGVDV